MGDISIGEAFGGGYVAEETCIDVFGTEVRVLFGTFPSRDRAEFAHPNARVLYVNPATKGGNDG